MQDGPSKEGNHEYLHCTKFLRDRTRQLHTYDRWNEGFYRIELILGEVYLHGSRDTPAFLRDVENSGGRVRTRWFTSEGTS